MSTNSRTWSYSKSFTQKALLKKLYSNFVIVPETVCPEKTSLAKLLFSRWPVGQGQLYGWTARIVWLPRVTERECTIGLPTEPASQSHVPGKGTTSVVPFYCQNKVGALAPATSWNIL
jgi:hypothetical protein